MQMISRTQIIERLSNLKQYRFVAYLEKLSDTQHKIRLQVKPWLHSSTLAGLSVQDFVVTEVDGKLMAKGINMPLLIDDLN